MTCEHLHQLEKALIAAGVRETFWGGAWSQNCREWVYFDCYIDVTKAREMFALSECVRDHSHRGTHDGSQQGFVCEQCRDGITGVYERKRAASVFPNTLLLR
jgi:hypothetical protein